MSILKDKQFRLIWISAILFCSCTSSKQLLQNAARALVNDSLLVSSHTGISVFDPAENKMLYDHQGDKFFVPASNVKIVTCYVAMKNMGNQIPGIGYIETDTAIILLPTGDPTLLHADYKIHPVADFLKASKKKLYINVDNWKEDALGSGWSWDDYSEDYMAERSALPVYGNVITWRQVKTKKENPQYAGDTIDNFIYAEPDIIWPVNFAAPVKNGEFSVRRERDRNAFILYEGAETTDKKEVPFITNSIVTALELLKDTVHQDIVLMEENQRKKSALSQIKPQIIFSQPLDSVLVPMMHRSDNFFAEQSLLMVSNQLLGVMNDDRIIDSLLKGPLNGFPQKPIWAEGSGLSRYNLFTPQDFVWLLNKMKNEFEWARIKKIFPTPGEGSLRKFNKANAGYLFAKTGSMSAVFSLSGYLVTKKNKTLIFSVMVNNNKASLASVRKKIEEFLTTLREHY